MKTTDFCTILLASAASVSAAALPNQARDVADGFYQVTVDDSGNTKTDFKPWAEISTTSVKPRSPLEKRREACGPGSVSSGEADEANTCLVDNFTGDNIYLNKNAWSYCVRGNVVSFICPYSDGYKGKADVKGTWSYVKGTCGPSKMGYAQVSNGVGDWTAGYATKDDHFCTADFKVGS
ncbi:uncharacterized protein ColSpa_06920 [Colletotrichum spaethianum]|uniref:Secreted protein n=1 Tax=Colletotrichum spaethianum TaxID=700344 RepID=A0AA37LI72_9PEZI|nr:uncharacterized protein ColSpa_06920 [Colletotrichum spaethianum]GKT46739.1 hypothetical protein ColSpa_06920 [Colletotrichum spaethianum]